MIMEILSVSDTRIKSDGVYYFYKPEYEDKGNFILRSRSTPIGCISLAASERYIYALVGEQYSSRDSQMLCIFDWKGRAVRRILFDCDVLGIALSDDAAGLYCWAERDGRPFLGKLEL